MAWRDKLRPASFRNISFYVEGHELEGGRRTTIHEYPLRDIPYAEDMGRRARMFQVDAFVVGDDYMDQRDALLKALETSGPGQLVHPYLGTMTVSAPSYRQSERADEGRMARFSIAFCESGDTKFPETGLNQARAADTAAGKVITASRRGFLDVFNTNKLPGFVADSAAQVTRSLAGEVLSAVGAGGGTSANVQLFTDNYSTLVGSADDAVRTGDQIADALIGLVQSAGAARGYGLDGLVTQIAIGAAGSAIGAVLGTTPARQQEQTNQDALINLVRHTALAEACRIVGGVYG